MNSRFPCNLLFGFKNHLAEYRALTVPELTQQMFDAKNMISFRENRCKKANFVAKAVEKSRVANPWWLSIQNREVLKFKVEFAKKIINVKNAILKFLKFPEIDVRLRSAPRALPDRLRHHSLPCQIVKPRKSEILKNLKIFKS